MSKLPERPGSSWSGGWSFDDASQAEARFCQGQEATIFRPSSVNMGLDLSSLIRLVAMTAAAPKDSDYHRTDTVHGQTDVPSFHFQASSLPNHSAYGVYWRSRAGVLLPVRRWKRRPVDASVRRMLYKSDVAVMRSDNPDFGGKGLPKDGGTALSGSAGTPTRGGRTSARAKRTSYANGTSQSASNRSRRRSFEICCIGPRDTGRHSVPETPTGSDGLQRSKTLETIFAALGSSRRRTPRRILSRTWEFEGRWPQ